MGVKERIQRYIDIESISISKFENSIGASNGYWRKTKNISANVVSDILRVYSDINPIWVMTGEGEMLKNISENTENLKQKDETIRNNSIESLINEQVKKAVMENIPAIITAIMDGMNKQMEGQNKVIYRQIDMLEKITLKLSELDTKSDKIQENIIKLSRKAE